MYMLYATLDYSNVFFINFKCCYSTFENLCREGFVKKINTNTRYIEDEKFKNKSDIKLWLVMRDPYSRIVSFYKDKFVNCYNGHFRNPNKQYDKQPCQKNMYKYSNESKIRSLEFKLSDLIDAIKRGYNDPHISSQANVLHINQFSGQINVIRIEDEEFANKCKEIFGFELLRHNSSDSEHCLDELTEDDRKFLYNKYKRDFELYIKQSRGKLRWNIQTVDVARGKSYVKHDENGFVLDEEGNAVSKIACAAAHHSVNHCLRYKNTMKNPDNTWKSDNIGSGYENVDNNVNNMWRFTDANTTMAKKVVGTATKIDKVKV